MKPELHPLRAAGHFSTAPDNVRRRRHLTRTNPELPRRPAAAPRHSARATCRPTSPRARRPRSLIRAPAAHPAAAAARAPPARGRPPRSRWVLAAAFISRRPATSPAPPVVPWLRRRPDLTGPLLPRPPSTSSSSPAALRRDPCCIEIRAKNPRSGGPISTKSPSFPCFKCPCSSCRNFASVAPFWAYSISKCSSQRAHHFISLHHFHLSSS